jgi:beta propeller repeat protein
MSLYMKLRMTAVICVVTVARASDESLAQMAVGETHQITHHPGIQTQPSISGDIVVWADDRSGVFDIYGYDFRLAAEFLIAEGGGNKEYPVIRGNIVTWFEGWPKTLKGCDLSNQKTFTIHTDIRGLMGTQYATILGRQVYYAVETGGNYAIHRYDLDSGQSGMESPVDDYYDFIDPDSRDGYVIWKAGGSPTQYILDVDQDLLSSIELQGNAPGPGVVASHFIYYAVRHELWIYDMLTGEFRRHPAPGIAHPSASGSVVVWTDGAEPPARRILGLDAETGEAFDVVVLEGPDGILSNQGALEIDGSSFPAMRTGMPG